MYRLLAARFDVVSAGFFVRGRRGDARRRPRGPILARPRPSRDAGDDQQQIMRINRLGDVDLKPG
jgi:hypothetical protein